MKISLKCEGLNITVIEGPSNFDLFKKLNDMDYMGFRDLECYKEGRILRLSVSKLVKKLPPIERFLLISQLLRASRGSTTEVMEHITVCFDEDYISKEEYTQPEQQCVLVFKLINGYINYLERRKNNKT